MELSFSVDDASGLVSVGYGEADAALPSDIRVLEHELGTLVAKAAAARLAHPAGGGVLDLDRLVAVAEAVMASRAAAPATTGSVGHAGPELEAADLAGHVDRSGARRHWMRRSERRPAATSPRTSLRRRCV